MKGGDKQYDVYKVHVFYTNKKNAQEIIDGLKGSLYEYDIKPKCYTIPGKSGRRKQYDVFVKLKQESNGRRQTLVQYKRINDGLELFATLIALSKDSKSVTSIQSWCLSEHGVKINKKFKVE